jgi:hypothetical protein
MLPPEPALAAAALPPAWAAVLPSLVFAPPELLQAASVSSAAVAPSAETRRRLGMR